MKLKLPLTFSAMMIINILMFGLLFSTTAFADDPLPPCNDSANANTAICKTDRSFIGGILKNVINVMLYLAGAIAVIMVVVGGIRYITSDGDPGAASKAKNTIIYALVGIVVASMSYAIVNFVIDRISI